ncbi:MAG: S-layer homology domain-containing protein [Propionibacteriaceae bacterium]|nr:S-layer homology domain-containing protein [Propionibacteriaceae bacterium]
MRPRLSALVPAAALVAASLLAAVPAQAADNVVPDTMFRACLNDYLGQAATAAITADQVKAIDGDIYGAVHCSDGTDPTSGASLFLTSIEGAQYLTGITALTLNADRLTDLTPLAGLTNLTSLSIYYADVSDLTPLKGLTQLRNLDLWGGQVTDVTPLAGLTDLRFLGLGHNQIADVSPLAGLTKLATTRYSNLNLDGNHITDLSVLGSAFRGAGTGDPASVTFADGVSATEQTSTIQVTPGTRAKPAIKGVASDTTGRLEVDVLDGPASVADDGTVTYEGPGTVTLIWCMVNPADGSWCGYFGGTLTVIVAAPAKPADCGITATTPLSGPTGGRFLDVLVTTPHAGDIDWLATAGWAIGWTVSCHELNQPGWAVQKRDFGYTLVDQSSQKYGVSYDLPGEVNLGTVGSVFQPGSEVTRRDAAVWLAQLALSDKKVDLTDEAAMAAFLGGDYSITNLTWARGQDGEWGTADDAKVVTIPVTSLYYTYFADTYPSDGELTADRQANAITWLANTIVNVKFSSDGTIISGQRLSTGFALDYGTAGYWGVDDAWGDWNQSREFRPYDTIVRQDMAAFLYRIALYEKLTGEHATVNLTTSQTMGGWTAHGEAVQWMAGAGITEGFADGSFGGLRPIVRQDLAAFLHRTSNWFTT